jgi:hypothetical protein
MILRSDERQLSQNQVLSDQITLVANFGILYEIRIPFHRSHFDCHIGHFQKKANPKHNQSN